MFNLSKYPNSRLVVAVTLALNSALVLAQTEDGLAIERIEVSAQKRSSYEQSTPIAMSALNSEALDDAGVNEVNDLSNIAPSLNIAQNNANTMITIRGVSSRDYTETGDPAVAVSIDNFYLQRSVGLNAALFDIQRVEVLRGPQGTLYGRNATAGTVNITTVKPSDDNEFKASLGLGNFDAIDAEVAGNVAVNDNLAIRASGIYRDREGYRENGSLENGDGQKDIAGRVHIKYNMGERLTTLLTAEVVETTGTGAVIKGIPYSDINDDGTLIIGNDESWDLNHQGYTDIKSDSLRWMANYDFDYYSLAYYGGYRDMSFNRDNDQDGGMLANLGFQQNEDIATQNHEIRLTSSLDGPFNFQMGAYFFKEKDDLLTYFQVNSDDAPAFNFYTFDYKTVSESLAFFAQSSYALSDDLTAEVGVRYTEDEKSQIGQNDVGVGSFSPLNNAYNDNEVTWHLGLNWTISDDHFAYAKIDRGYKAGGYTSTQEFAPEAITAFEIGSKSYLLNNSMQLNINAFYYDYTDLQVQQTDPDLGISQVYNAGEATVTGAELEIQYSMTTLDKLKMSLSYVDATFDTFCTTTLASCPDENDFSGNSLPQAPKWSGLVGYSHDFVFASSLLTAQINSRFQQKSYFTYINRATEQQESYTKTDLLLKYTMDGSPFTYSAYIRNIEDSQILTASEEAAYAGGYLVQFAAPRTFGVNISYEF